MISCLGPPILLLIETVCRYPVRALFTATRTATGLRRISTQQEMDSTRDADFGLVKPLSLWSGTQQDIASMTENHGVPGSNPGPATSAPRHPAPPREQSRIVRVGKPLDDAQPLRRAQAKVTDPDRG
jgi:hypothetical protein